MADYLSSSPARPYSSPLPLAKTIVFAGIVLLGSFASDRSRSSRSLAFTARSSLIAVYSELFLTPVRPLPFCSVYLLFMILIFVQTLVFVNNIHERPLRSLPFVPTRSPSSKLRLALACLRRRSWPITCLHRPLVFIARSSILVAFTARKDYSLCEYRSSRIVRLGSQPFVPLARLHRPIVADRSVFGTISHSSASSTVWRCVSLIHDPYIRADFSLRE